MPVSPKGTKVQIRTQSRSSGFELTPVFPSFMAWKGPWLLLDCDFVCVLVTQSYPTLCISMDCSPPGSPVHGILQARILEWVAIPFFRGYSWPRDQTQVSYTAGRCLTVWATRKTYVQNRISNVFILPTNLGWTLNRSKMAKYQSFHKVLLESGAFLVAGTVKNPPAMQETQVQSIQVPRSGRSLQYSWLENSMNRGA